MREREKEGAVVGLLLLLTLLFWGRFFLGGLVFYARDLGFFFAPLRHALAQAIRGGAAPVWNPYLGAGIPMAADPNSASFFPPTLLFLMRPFSSGVRWSYALWLLAFPLGAYAGLRGLRVSPRIAAGAAFAISICGPAMTLTSFPHVAWASMLFLPLVWLAKSGADGRGKCVLAAGIAFGVAILVGEPAIALHLLFAVALFTLFGRGRPRTRAGAAAGAAIAGLGALIAAPQILGALELLPQTARGAGLPLQYAAAFNSVRPARLLGFLWPGLFGDVNSPLPDGFWGGRFFDAGTPYISSLAVGTMTLALLPAAWKDSTGRRFAILAAVAAVLSFGRHLPGGTVLLGLPGFSLLRYPEKWLFLGGFSAIAAAAFALDRIRGGDERARRAAAAGCAALFGISILAVSAVKLIPKAVSRLLQDLLILPSPAPSELPLTSIGWDAGQAALFALAGLLALHGLRDSERRRWLAPALGLLVLLDLFPRTWNWTSLAPPALFDREPAETAAAVRQGGRLYYGEETEVAADALRPMTPVLWGVSFAGNNDIDRFSPRRSFLFGREVGRLTFADPRKARLLALADVRCVSTTDPSAEDGTGLTPLFRTSPARAVYALSGGARFRALYRTTAVAGEDAARTALLSVSFDPEKWAVVEAPADLSLSGEGTARVTAVGRRADAETVEVESTAKALLLRSETYEPRWRATVDGKEAKIFPADYAFQGVVVPPGRHGVAFRYVDRLMMLGMCISLAALAACVRALAARPTPASRSRRGHALG
jgi:hypothetical protein